MNTLKTNVSILSARRYAWAAVVAVGAFLAMSAPCSGQTTNRGQGTTNSGQITNRNAVTPRSMDELDMETRSGPIFYEKRLQMLNKAQHQSMVADTDRLLKLVANLNVQISTSNSSALTPEQLRMVAEIEKLAHNVKDKMRMSVRSSVEMAPSPLPPTPYGVR